MAFGPNYQPFFDLFQERFISDGNALGPLAFPNDL
jgi:hypothetical protein